MIVARSLPMTKHIVIRHTAGPFLGLTEIVGTLDLDSGQVLPAVLQDISLSPDQRVATAQLSRVEPRYALYREIDAAGN